MEMVSTPSQGGQPPKSFIKKQTGEDAIKKRVRPFDGFITGTLFVTGIFSIFTTLAIVYFLGQETLLFFDSKAFVIARLPVIDDALDAFQESVDFDDADALAEFADARVAEPIASNQNTFTISFEGDRVPFLQLQFIQLGVGDEREVMRITDRGRRTITVERGLDGTEPRAHGSGTLVFGMNERQVTITQPIPNAQSIENIPWELVTLPYMAIGDEFDFRGQTVRISDFNSTNAIIQCVGPVTQTFNRGDLPRRLAQALSEGETFDYNNLRWRVETLNSNQVQAACVPESTTQVAWAVLPVQMLRINNILDYQDKPWRVTAYTNQSVRLERCEPGQFIDIQLLPTFGRAFEAGQFIQIGARAFAESPETLLIESVNEDSIRAERCVEGTPSISYARGDEGFPSISIGQEVTFGEFLTSTIWQPQNGSFGIIPLVTATILISVVAIIVAIPIGLGAAIYLSEYAPMRVRNTLKPILELLAGVPTVVFGFFAVSFVSPLLQNVFGNVVQGQNILTAGLVVGFLIVPIISALSEEALRAVPRALREASYGMGATKLETTVRVIFPAAISGIIASVILAASRAVGETMVVALAAGSVPKFTFNVFEGAEAMTGYITRISGGDIAYNSIDYNSIFVVGATLFIMTLLLNIFSSIVANRLREAY